jgi:hypothetical protein
VSGGSGARVAGQAPRGPIAHWLFPCGLHPA